MKDRYFTVDEARALLPELRQLISKANKELDERTATLQHLNNRYLKAEKALDQCQTPEDEDDSNTMSKFRNKRAQFELAISDLSKEQAEFIRILEGYVDKISSHGVILRKMKEGLIDFPACQGEFKYFLCWQHDESDISHWHLDGDGFIGRKSLRSLCEYF